MLGPNPRRAGMSTASSIVPSPTTEMPLKTAATAQQSDGLMVKAIDEIFRHVEINDAPDSFKVNDRVITNNDHNLSLLPYLWRPKPNIEH